MLAVTGPYRKQHVGMARRGHEAQAEALQVVEGVSQRVDLELAAIARSGVDLADRQRAAEPAARCPVDAARELGEARIVGRGRRLGEGGLEQALEQQLAHGALSRSQMSWPE
jgi:hypothetical protein